MSCRDCKHVSQEGFSEPLAGACRRFPPTALNAATSTFPIVHIDKFSCGEFAAAKESATPTPMKSAQPGVSKKAGNSRRSSK
jgi:hypothetical protein